MKGSDLLKMSDMKYLNDGVILNDEQLALKNAIVKWYTDYKLKNHPQDGMIYRDMYFTYSGPAGSGKTTVMRQALEALGMDITTDVACVAYVGKAVMVMKMNGLDARTIHSLIYNAGIETERDEVHDRWIKKWKFTLKSKDYLEKYKIIFCDEAAMVPDNIFRDLMSFGIPVIFAGDGNQLPPVMSSSNILNDPNFVLTKIMRQSEGNPIVELSQMVLNNRYLFCGNYGNSRVLDDIILDERILNDYDVILTNTIRLRESVNRYIRKEILKVRDLSVPHIGEKMICRSNEWDYCIDGFFLVNGMTGTLVDVYPGPSKKSFTVDFFPDVFDMYKDDTTKFDKIFWAVRADKVYLDASPQERRELKITKFTKMEYAYAINVHVAQGSQYNRVLYLDDPFSPSPDMMKKLRYTAITRAIDKIDIVKIGRGSRLYVL